MIMDLLPMLADAAATGAPVVESASEIASAGHINGSFTLGLAGFGSAIGVGLIGAKAAEAVGRNPSAFGNILTISIIGMALAEAIAIYALILAFGGR